MAMPEERRQRFIGVRLRPGRLGHPWIQIPSHKAGSGYKRRTIAHTGHGLLIDRGVMYDDSLGRRRLTNLLD